MYLKLFVSDIPLDDLSSILRKPIEEPYTKWIHGKNLEGTLEVIENVCLYTGYVKNPPVHTMKKLRKMNKASYVSTDLASVCFFNTVGYFDMFKDTLNKKFRKEFEAWDVKYAQRMVFGPWVVKFDYLRILYEGVGIVVRHTDDPLIFELETMEQMSVVEFLQKVYVINEVIAWKYEPGNGEKEKKSLKLRCKTYSDDWIESIEDRYLTYLILGTKKFKDFIKEKLRLEEENSGKRAAAVDNNREAFEDTIEIQGKTLHEMRHDFIINAISNYHEKDDVFNVIDYGCGFGKVSKKIRSEFPNAVIVGFDGNHHAATGLKKKNIGFHPCNLVAPPGKPLTIDCDILVLCEVIEHLSRKGRAEVMFLIAQCIRPKRIILTTPNIEWNHIFIPHLRRFRHWDHKIEFNTAEFQEEVEEPLTRASYKINHHNMFPEEPVQPSFVIVATVNDTDRNLEKHHLNLSNRLAKLKTDLYLPKNRINIDLKFLANGMNGSEFGTNGENVFYCSPTTAPVYFEEEAPDYIEHPISAFKYYDYKGLKKVVAEKKYMGSRAQIFAFRSEECALDRDVISVITKRGNDFFTENNQLKLEIWAELQQKLEENDLDFVILDCEILPWSLKGKRLIREDFLEPVECALTFRSEVYGVDSPEYEAAATFKNTLEWFSQEEAPHARAFRVLAAGKVKDGKYDTQYLGNYMKAEEHYELLDKFVTEHVKAVEYQYVDLNSGDEKMAAIENWKEYCSHGGEGWIIKTYPTLNESDSLGQPILPMWKVRGREYLSLVYGIDYLDQEYFDSVKSRYIKPKKELSIRQNELANLILECYLTNTYTPRLRYIMAFYGIESRKINATL